MQKYFDWAMLQEHGGLLRAPRVAYSLCKDIHADIIECEKMLQGGSICRMIIRTERTGGFF